MRERGGGNECTKNGGYFQRQIPTGLGEGVDTLSEGEESLPGSQSHTPGDTPRVFPTLHTLAYLDQLPAGFY